MPGPNLLHRLGDGCIRFLSGDPAFGGVPLGGVKRSLDTRCRGTTRLFVGDGPGRDEQDEYLLVLANLLGPSKSSSQTRCTAPNEMFSRHSRLTEA